MLTGDFGLTAKTIAVQIGLMSEKGRVVQGDELSAMSDADLQQLLRDEPEIIFARIAPAQKLQVVQALQANGEIVTVTGDGVNDAPALKNADMGVAMGMMGTDVAKEASNMVLMDDNFATIVTAVEEGRTIFDNIKKFIAYILTSNIPEILPFIAFVLLDIPLPLTVILILSIDLGTDILPALGLGAEKPETDVMKRKPRPRGERLLSRNLLLMSYGIVGMLQAAAGFFTYFTILYSGGWEWGQVLANDDPLYRTAITGFFASIIICQVADVIICRTRRQSVFTVGFFSNRLVLFGIGFELLLLASISYIPAFNTFFGTAPLEPWHLMLSVPFALAILVGDEVRRVFVRRGNRFVLRWLTW
jgi:sodium/potassium-transporting ATPase subunit alpha